MAENQEIPIYRLVPTDSSEGRKMSEALGEPCEGDLDFVIPKIVPWETSARMTNKYANDPANYPKDLKEIEEAMFQIFNSVKTHKHDFMFFMDQNNVISSPNTIIVAQPDAYYLWYSETAYNAYRELSASLVASGQLPADDAFKEDDTLVDGDDRTLFNMALDRGLTYGRIPISQWKLTWANLDLANMDLSELVDYHNAKEEGDISEEDPSDGTYVKFIPNPDWDGLAFLLKHAEIRKLVERQLRDEAGAAE